MIILTGPLDAPTVTNTSIAGSPSIVFADGNSVDEGDQVVIDLDPMHLITYYVGGIWSPSALVPILTYLDFASTTFGGICYGGHE